MEQRDLKGTLVEKRDGVGIVFLNRPDKLNALNSDIIEDLFYLMEAFEEDPGFRHLLFLLNLRNPFLCRFRPIFLSIFWFFLLYGVVFYLVLCYDNKKKDFFT